MGKVGKMGGAQYVYYNKTTKYKGSGRGSGLNQEEASETRLYKKEGCCARNGTSPSILLICRQRQQAPNWGSRFMGVIKRRP